jgi:putative oxygen-independent coproporphyrinogen III oxidase
MSLPPLSLYLHLPWCMRKCPYCDFNSHRAQTGTPFGRYVDAIVGDIHRESEKAAGRSVESIFLGGGTPSLFSPDRIADILNACRRSLVMSDDCEVSMEVNPGTVEHGSLAGYRDAGVSRLSIGAQSFQPGMLEVLGRIHGPDDIVTTYREAAVVGFDSINIDLMFALPGQDVGRALEDVRALVDLSPPHVSYYQLTLEPNTVFHRQPPASLPDDDLAWRIQEAGHEALAAAGYEQYEISAFSRPGHRCRHNLNYWLFGDYLAAGAGAHGKLTSDDGQVRRYRKPAHPLAYMEALESGDTVSADPVPPGDLAFEFMLNALRLSDGFPGTLFNERTGHQLADIEAFGSATGDGLIEESAPGHWRPTADGFRLLNDLQARFLR